MNHLQEVGDTQNCSVKAVLSQSQNFPNQAEPNDGKAQDNFDAEDCLSEEKKEASSSRRQDHLCNTDSKNTVADTPIKNVERKSPRDVRIDSDLQT